MKDIDFELLRIEIKKIFHQWYENKTKEKYEENHFSKSFYTSNLDTHEHLVQSFKDILDVTVGACTFRKLFYYKSENFNKSTLKKFNDYITSQNINENNTYFNEDIIKNEYIKWSKSLESPIINHHYFINQHQFRQIIVFAISNANKLNQKYINLLMINAIYYGDYSMHYFIDRCKNEQELIRYLINLVLFNWARVS